MNSACSNFPSKSTETNHESRKHLRQTCNSQCDPIKALGINMYMLDIRPLLCTLQIIQCFPCYACLVAIQSTRPKRKARPVSPAPVSIVRYAENNFTVDQPTQIQGRSRLIYQLIRSITTAAPNTRNGGSARILGV